MTLMVTLRAIRASLARPGNDCRSCGHFCDEPQAVEAALPGVATLASSHSSVWAQSGLCLLHDRVTNGGRRCPAFTDPRP